MSAASVEVGANFLATSGEVQWHKTGFEDFMTTFNAGLGKKYLLACEYLNQANDAARNEALTKKHLESFVQFLNTDVDKQFAVCRKVARCSARMYLASMAMMEQLALMKEPAAWAKKLSPKTKLPAPVQRWLREPTSRRKLVEALTASMAGRHSQKAPTSAGQSSESSSDSTSKAAGSDSSSSSSSEDEKAPAAKQTLKNKTDKAATKEGDKQGSSAAEAKQLKKVLKEELAKKDRSKSELELPINVPDMKNAQKHDKAHVNSEESILGARPAESDSDKKKKNEHGSSDSTGDEADDESSTSDKKASKSKRAKRKGAASSSKDGNKRSKKKPKKAGVSDDSSVERLQDSAASGNKK